MDFLKLLNFDGLYLLANFLRYKIEFFPFFSYIHVNNDGLRIL